MMMDLYQTRKRNKMMDSGGINCFNDDILHNILGSLPASSFAVASCVCKDWYRVCSQILNRPKLASALSLNPSVYVAVNEVAQKVLCKPIRPDFAIAYIGEKSGLGLAHQLLTQILGARTPLITHVTNGVMGMDALTEKLKEVQWDNIDNSFYPHESDEYDESNHGILLVVGYLPGLKIDAVPLLHSKRDREMTMTDQEEFVTRIKAYTAAVSGYEFPVAIMMFGDRSSDMDSIVAKMDHVMPMETAIVGDKGGCFLFNSLNYTIPCDADSYKLDAVALVFAEDRHKSPDVGKTRFHVAMAGDLVSFGPPFEVVDAGLVEPRREYSWLYAKIKGHDAVFNLEDLLEMIEEGTEIIEEGTVHDLQLSDLYIGVTQQRRYNSRESTSLTTSTAFHNLIGSDYDVTFFIEGVGVRPGDSFMFYNRDREIANKTNAIACGNLNTLKENKSDKEGVFGGLIFSSHSRGESYFGKQYVDTLPFTLNFPGVPVVGAFCNGEIWRAKPKYSNFMKEEEYEEQSVASCSIHACSAVYLAMSHIPAPPLKR